MTTEVLGKISFLDTPSVNGTDVLLNAGGVPSISAGSTGSRPSAGQTGRIYLDTSTNIWYRDNGSSWDDLSQLAQVSGTTNQIVVTPAVIGTPAIVGLASNPTIPGAGGMILPVGSTAQRGSNTAGNTRFNNTIGYEEIYDGTSWRPVGQILQLSTSTISAQTFNNTQIPLDSTIPQITEGSQIWTSSFTPISSISTVVVDALITAAHGTAGRALIMSLFNGATNALASSATYIVTASTASNLVIRYSYSPGSTAPITFSLRFGANGTGNSYVNQYATNTLGGTLVSAVKITEVL